MNALSVELDLWDLDINKQMLKYVLSIKMDVILKMCSLWIIKKCTSCKMWIICKMNIIKIQTSF